MLFATCKSYKMLDGRSRPVYFTQTSNDKDSGQLPPLLTYQDFGALSGNRSAQVTFDENGKGVALINKPTFFYYIDYFIAYPGDKITISYDQNDEYVFQKKHGTKRRNRELDFSRIFESLERSPGIPSIQDVTIETILQAEEQLKRSIVTHEEQAKRLFDSLIVKSGTSRKFRRLSRGFTDGHYYSLLAEFYDRYKDTLAYHNLFYSKSLSLLQNHLTLEKPINFVRRSAVFNQLADSLLPFRMRSVTTLQEFIADFDAIRLDFAGKHRDYLLSQLFYNTIMRRVQIPETMFARYYSLAEDKKMKTLIQKLQTFTRKSSYASSSRAFDGLLSHSTKNITSIEEIVRRSVGQVLLVDFWATWCGPCKADSRVLDTLLHQYNQKDLKLVKIAMDRNSQTWTKAVHSTRKSAGLDYLMLTPDSSGFCRKNKINTVPRYMLFDKKGVLVNADAPGPSEIGLKLQIDKLIKE